MLIVYSTILNSVMLYCFTLYYKYCCISVDLVFLFKAHLLRFLEHRIPAVCHTTRAYLRRLHAVQSGFPKDIAVV